MALLRALLLVVLCVATAEARGLRAGDPAPALSLPDASGRAVTLADRRGRVVCVDFWASWCAHCRTALPALDAIARRHAGQGLEVLAVGIDHDEAAAARFLAATLPAPAVTVLHDPDGAVFARFAPSGMPALYVVDAAGTLRLVAEGYDARDLEAIEHAIEHALAERPAP